MCTLLTCAGRTSWGWGQCCVMLGLPFTCCHWSLVQSCHKKALGILIGLHGVKVPGVPHKLCWLLAAAGLCILGSLNPASLVRQSAACCDTCGMPPVDGTLLGWAL